MRYKYVSILAGWCILVGGISLLRYQQQPRHHDTQHPIQRPIQRSIKIKRIAFGKLPGWQSAHALSSLRTFQLSCRHFLRMDPKYSVGNTRFRLRAKDWRPACETALTMQTDSEIQAKNFFETWFQPVEFSQKQVITGLFTGYYLPAVSASLTKTEEYTVPIYGLPNNLLMLNLNDFDPNLPSRQLFGRLENKRIRPFYSRKEIDQGAIADTAPVLAYLRSPIDRLLIEIQGSALLNLPDGKQINLGYAGKNGLTYTAIGRVLIDRKILPANQVSIPSIRAYLESHPEERDEIIHQNRSFVFFEMLHKKGAYGTLGTRLTKGYSLAVDPDWVPLGMPVWLATTYPDPHSEQQHSFHRLMIAQDTGGAIKGTVRGDMYWGSGEDAAAIAGKMKSTGRYWLLVPKS